MRWRGLWLGGWLAAALVAQTAPVVVGVPAAFAPSVAGTLFTRFGSEVVVRPLEQLHSDPVPEVAIYLLGDEWALARLAGRGALQLPPARGAQWPWPKDAAARCVLPFVAIYGLAVPVAQPERPPRTWEELALDPAGHDRLQLPAPEVDGAPWLLAMQQGLSQGGGAARGVATWTTIDARVGRLASSYAALLASLAAGPEVSAVGPWALLERELERRPGQHRLQPMAEPHLARFGLGLQAGASEPVQAVFARLLEPATLQALGTAVGMEVSARGPEALDGATALAFWERFQAVVRGRGRSVESLSDWLDLVFGIVFLGLLALLLRSQRRREAHEGG